MKCAYNKSAFIHADKFFFGFTIGYNVECFSVSKIGLHLTS